MQDQIVTSSLGGAKGNRTPDLLNAIQALSQLSYGPLPRGGVLAPKRCMGKGGRAFSFTFAYEGSVARGAGCACALPGA